MLPGCTGSLTKLMPCSHHALAMLMPSSPVVRSSSESPQSPSPPHKPLSTSQPRTLTWGSPCTPSLLRLLLVLQPFVCPSSLPPATVPGCCSSAWGMPRPPCGLGLRAAGWSGPGEGGNSVPTSPRAQGLGAQQQTQPAGAQPAASQATGPDPPRAGQHGIPVPPPGRTASSSCPWDAQHPHPAPRKHSIPALSPGGTASPTCPQAALPFLLCVEALPEGCWRWLL